jgi:nicotinamide phosphoribosyltransferase
MNLLMKADSYKVSHFNQYPDGTEHVYSYIEPRKGTTPVVIIGINDFIDQLRTSPDLLSISLLEDVAERHGVPFNRDGWLALVQKYQGKHWPLVIMGVPEGTVVEPQTPVACICNTDPEFPWLTSFFETLFLRCVWYPSSVASVSRYCKTRIAEYMEKTGADMTTLPFKLHDFGARGATCGEAAAKGGAGHLINFMGTDTLEAIEYVADNYGEPMAGFSIPATEHSTVTSWGRDCERQMYERFLQNNLGAGKIAACVSDSYNIWEALEMWKELEPVLLEVGGTLVIRPDSGDPIETPVKVIKELMQLFGFTTNAKGFKVLPDHIRVIQGDGINEQSLVRILQRLYDAKISIDNIAFGMGGGLLQKVDRDTYGWAMKCSAARVNGEWRDVYKDPIGGGKTSKKGLVNTETYPCDYEEADVYLHNALAWGGFVTYYRNGTRIPKPTWADIRERAEVK